MDNMKDFSILIVEDDNGHRLIYQNYLQSEGYKVCFATNYEEAINALKEQPFDVALVDLRLEKDKYDNRDGLRIIGEISKMEEGPQVILATAFLGEIDPQSAQYAFAIFNKKDLSNKELIIKLVNDAISEKAKSSPVSVRNWLYRLVEQMVHEKLQLREVCNLILERMMKLLGAEAGNLFIVKEDKLVAITSTPTPKEEMEKTLEINNSISGLAIRRYAHVYVGDLRNSNIRELYQPGLDIEARSELAIPTIIGVKSIAVLNFESPRVNAFQISDIEMLEKELAPTIAVVVHDAILQQSLIDQAKHVIQLSDISEELNSNIQKGEVKVAKLMLDRMPVFLDCSKAAIFLTKVQEGQQSYSLFAHKGLSEEYVRNSQNIDLSSPRAYVARTGLSIYINDIDNDDDIKFLDETDFVRTTAKKEGYQSVLELPLQIQDNIIGSIVAYYIDCCHFKAGSEELALAQTLADHFAIAMNNAQQYQALKELRQRDRKRAEERLAGEIVHQMVNPLGAVKALVNNIETGYGDLLEKNPNLKDDFSEIKVNAVKAMDLVEELRLEQGKLQAEAVDIMDRLKFALNAARIDRETVKLKVIAGDEQILVLADRELSRVFVNLIENAIEAMPDGGALEIGVKVANECAEVWVSDTGQGIRAEKPDDIFRQWFTSKKGEGHGFGLWWVKNYIETFDGVIIPESQLNQGTKMTFRLPLASTRQGQSIVDNITV